MIIDFHTHIFPPFIANNRDKYISSDSLFKTLYSDAKAKLTTADDLISSMDTLKIDKSVILNIAWDNPETCRLTNDYIIESVSRFPGRLIGFCTVNFADPESAILEIERCRKEGLKGIGEIRPDNQFLDPNNYSLKPVINYTIEHNLIILSHTSEPVGHLYPGKGDITPEALYPFIKAYPGLKFVCAHWGGGLPFYSLMPKVKPFFKDIYFDSAASPFLYQPEVYSQVAQLVGPDKILFGSDYPLLSPQRLLNEINKTLLSSELKEAILAKNALKLLEITCL